MGTIVAFHFPATDIAAAAAFYRAIFGWNVVPDPLSARRSIAEIGAVNAAFIERTDALPHPIPVFAVPVLDAALERLVRLGGAMNGMDAIPGAGPYVYAHDSEGNVIALVERRMHRVATQDVQAGNVVNVHLPADDVGRAVAFYANLFGWKLTPHPGPIPYVTTDPRQPEGSGIEVAIVQREQIVKGPTPTIDVPWIDETLAEIAMRGGQQSTANTIPGIGRFGYAKDCDLNTIALLQRTVLVTR